MNHARTFRWQIITLAILFVGYAGYYLCRSVLSVATPLLLRDPSAGLTKHDVGLIASLGVLLYAIGKTINGLLVDRVGGRLLFVVGMVVSVGCTVLFGLAGSMLAFAAVWSVNRYVQSVGWGALVYLASRWFPTSVRARVMGVLSMSFLLGDAVVRSYLAGWLYLGVGWRRLFFLAAATLGLIAVATLFLLKSSPQAIGGAEPEEGVNTVYGPGADTPAPGFLALLLPLLTSVPFWLVCFMSVGLTLIRETFNFWTPTYLVEVAGLSEANAAQGSMIFPLVGGVAALVGGLLSDGLGGKHGRILVPSLVLLVGALTLMAVVPVQGRPWLALGLIGVMSFFLLVPYCFLAGVMALDLGGKRGSSTAAGLIDSAGYFGGTLSGYAVGAVVEAYGWQAAFGTLAVVAVPTTAAAAIYCYLQETQARRALFAGAESSPWQPPSQPASEQVTETAPSDVQKHPTGDNPWLTDSPP